MYVRRDEERQEAEVVCLHSDKPLELREGKSLKGMEGNMKVDRLKRKRRQMF